MGVNRSPTVLQQWRQTSRSATAECTNNSTSVKCQWTWRILARPWARLVPQLYVLYYWWRHSLMHHKKTDTAYEETVDVKWLFTWLGLSARIISVIYWTMTFHSRRQANAVPHVVTINSAVTQRGYYPFRYTCGGHCCCEYITHAHFVWDGGELSGRKWEITRNRNTLISS